MTEQPNPDVAWFLRTGHCGGCGQPGAVCICGGKYACGCRHLHPMGGGIDTTADERAALFADAPAEPPPEQDGLF